MKKSRYEYPVPEHQADATLSQANPVSGTKYTVLDTTKNVRLLNIIVRVTWTVQPTPLEVHITIDGQVVTFTKTDPVTITSYFPQTLDAFTLPGGVLDTVVVHRAFLLEGRSVKVEVETTGGTVSNLSARVKYARW